MDDVDRVLATAGVAGEPKIYLRKIGRIAGMDLYIDVAKQVDPEKAYKLALDALFRAFVGSKK